MKRGGRKGGKEFDWLEEFDCAEREKVDAWSTLSEAEKAEIERLDTEVCGLLPCSLEPVEPSEACKDKLLKRLSPTPVLSLPAPTSPRERSVAGRWLLPLAAGLAVLAVGFSATMVSTVRDQRRQLAQLEGKVEALSEAAAESTQLAAGLAAARENLRLVSTRGVGICALRPTASGAGAEDGPYGLLFVAPDHQHWYVKVAGIDPTDDRYYRIWFETEEGQLVAAGNLTAGQLELSAPTMPKGTKAVHVSIETDPAAAVPSDDLLLFGDDMVQVL